MASTSARNDFLLNLLTLQQDGRQAISAPANWTHKPLLEVKTKLDEIVEELEEAILVGEPRNDTARWHFFIGSPGNGKSAAMGKLSRRLREKGCQVRDESGVEIGRLQETDIPYALGVYENDNKFTTVQLVQDASVVRDPFSPDIDPAKELLGTIKSAWKKGRSLVVCANRGVLEKAYRDNQTDSNINSMPWFQILKAVVLAEKSLRGTIKRSYEFTREEKPVFKKLTISYSQLDEHSLLREENTFDNLFKEATSANHWKPCVSCTAKDMCPFKANRDWLADEEARANVLQLLQRAEMLSGQVIVFREALAIVSLILAGCPRDYDRNGLHPCEWVQAASMENDVFSLAARRIYMCLFASHSPHGLEELKPLREQLKVLFETMENTKSKKAVKHVVNGQEHPSTDVGVTRLLGASGIIADLDPCKEALPAEFYDDYDCGNANLKVGSDPWGALFTPIEHACLATWKNLENCLEKLAKPEVSPAHWALQRWSSNFLLHFGALYEGRSAWAKELDAFANLLDLVKIPSQDRSSSQTRQISEVNRQVEILLDSTVTLSGSVTLLGKWVNNNLNPKIVSGKGAGSVSLTVKFPEGEEAVFTAPMYLWLTRCTAGKLDRRCLPQELLSRVADVRVRAASKGEYAFKNDDVELVIDMGKGKKVVIRRLDGHADANFEE